MRGPGRVHHGVVVTEPGRKEGEKNGFFSRSISGSENHVFTTISACFSKGVIPDVSDGDGGGGGDGVSSVSVVSGAPSDPTTASAGGATSGWSFVLAVVCCSLALVASAAAAALLFVYCKRVKVSRLLCKFSTINIFWTKI